MAIRKLIRQGLKGGWVISDTCSVCGIRSKHKNPSVSSRQIHSELTATLPRKTRPPGHFLPPYVVYPPSRRSTNRLRRSPYMTTRTRLKLPDSLTPIVRQPGFQGPKTAAFFLALTSSVDALPACHSHEQLVPWPLIWPSLQEVLLVCPIAGTAAPRPREATRVPFSSWPFDKKV
jgi:hypothetical protein